MAIIEDMSDLAGVVAVNEDGASFHPAGDNCCVVKAYKEQVEQHMAKRCSTGVASMAYRSGWDRVFGKTERGAA